jgi:hypothetical protein
VPHCGASLEADCKKNNVWLTGIAAHDRRSDIAPDGRLPPPEGVRFQLA